MSGLNHERFWRDLLGAGLLHAILVWGMLSMPLPAPSMLQPKPVELVWLEPPAEEAEPPPAPPVPHLPRSGTAIRPAARALERASAALRTTEPASPLAEYEPPTSEEALPPSQPTGRGAALSHDQLFPATLEGLGLEAAGTSTGDTATAGTGATSRTSHRSRGLLDAEGVRDLLRGDAKTTQAQLRADRALHSKTLRDYGDRMESVWEVRLEEVKRWPTRPEVKLAHPGPESMRDFRRGGWGGLDISDPCAYERHSLGWVRLSLDAQGRLLKREVVKSTGSRRMDKEVLRLVDKSAPFTPPEAQDLGQDGLSRSTWDVGVRDYSRSSCFTPGQKPLVKDIILVAIEP